MFFTIGVLKSFANCTAKHLCYSLFLMKLQVCIKERFQHSVFLWNLGNFKEHLFLQNTSRRCFWGCFWCILSAEINAVDRLYPECKPGIYFFPINCCLQMFREIVDWNISENFPKFQRYFFLERHNITALNIFY